MIDISAARKLLDFGARIGAGPRAEEQLEGAVALHNVLETHRVAYLADEVGMGKTYVALGALALFRHYNPNFRVLVIAPRENIQRKWMKEFSNFAANNMRFPDLRVVNLERRPARRMVACDSLLSFVREVAIDSRQDFFLRLSSFSLALGSEGERSSWRHVRDQLRREIPWLPEEALDLRISKEDFKDNFARAICCVLPVFDLVIVDEGHNLKRGFRDGVAARNRVLALAFGHPSHKQKASKLPKYGSRASRVLFLSATPLEESYGHLWNQLDVFGHGSKFSGLSNKTLSDDEKQKLAGEFLIRRVTTMKAGGTLMTKNQYRREWRRGGVVQHDEPVVVDDDRQRLVVALVQKKVAELLGSEKFNMSFQIGMLASFESFLETTQTRHADGTEYSNFDDPEQTENPNEELARVEREGIDVRDVNRIASDYRQAFGTEMPHPKMDALVASLQESWKVGKKALVFVRRVKSVEEIKRKLDEKYDEWLLQSLRSRLPASVHERFARVERQYYAEKRKPVEEADPAAIEELDDEDLAQVSEDAGGSDTFFAWFFRGVGPKGIISGANVQRRFIQKGTVYSTFFEQNYVMSLLADASGSVADKLGAAVQMDTATLRRELNLRAVHYLGRAKRPQRGERFEAAQAAAFELLQESRSGYQKYAGIVWRERFQDSRNMSPSRGVVDVMELLEQPTFFSELLKPEWSDLRQAIWPGAVMGDISKESSESLCARFRQQELSAQLLSAAARLGHSLIDLYVLTIQRLKNLELRSLDVEASDGKTNVQQHIFDYLNLLERQRLAADHQQGWGAFHELSNIASNLDLILDVNAAEAREKSLSETVRYFGSILRQQQPIGGMSGKINKTLVQQFRMPGYPLVLVTTDLLQEGEDLHTFCADVHHYGIAWTPSSMEQRIGRIDRVRSLTDRRLNGSASVPPGNQLLQVFYPHLEDTVEVLQVRRVLSRMNTFLRLMHEGLAVKVPESPRINVAKEIASAMPPIDRIEGFLRTAFPIKPHWRVGGVRSLAIDSQVIELLVQRFEKLGSDSYEGLPVVWEKSIRKGQLLGTAKLASGRIQPFTLMLSSFEERPLVRCISPVGLVGYASMEAEVAMSARSIGVRLGAIPGRDGMTYDLTVEEDVLLGDAISDRVRIGAMLNRVLRFADEFEKRHLRGLDAPLKNFEVDLIDERVA